MCSGLSYLKDSDPRHYKSDVDLTSNNLPGQYSVRFHLEETGPAALQGRMQELVAPVIVR